MYINSAKIPQPQRNLPELLFLEDAEQTWEALKVSEMKEHAQSVGEHAERIQIL